MIEAVFYIAVLPVLAFLIGMLVVEIVDRSRNV
jgi:hypothetical protein